MCSGEVMNWTRGNKGDGEYEMRVKVRRNMRERERGGSRNISVCNCVYTSVCMDGVCVV